MLRSTRDAPFGLMNTEHFRYRATEEADTLTLARCFAPFVRAGDRWFLQGGLGAGKTTFFRALAYALGVPESTAVTSPTYALVHEYEAPRVSLVHVDLYRLEPSVESQAANPLAIPDQEKFEAGAQILESLGILELEDEGAALFIEWGERLGPHFAAGATGVIRFAQLARSAEDRVVGLWIADENRRKEWSEGRCPLAPLR